MLLRCIPKTNMSFGCAIAFLEDVELECGVEAFSCGNHIPFITDLSLTAPSIMVPKPILDFRLSAFRKTSFKVVTRASNRIFYAIKFDNCVSKGIGQ